MKRFHIGIYLAALCATMAPGLESQTLPASFPATGSTVMTVLSTANLTGQSCGTYSIQYYNALTNQHWACYNPNPSQNAMGTWVLVNSSTPGGSSNAVQFNNAGAFGGVLNASSAKGYLYQIGGAAPQFQLTPVPLSDIAAPSLTAGTNMTITGTWPNLTFSASSGGWQIGTLANIPPTCTVGQAYFATDQPANQQIYTCSVANTWTKSLLLGPSGALAVTGGALDITNTVPQKGTPNSFMALNTFRAGLNLDTTNTPPACSSTTRGYIWFVNGGSSADSFEICEYNGSAYAWTAGGGGSYSGPGNQVVATPANGSTGVAAVRALVSADMPPINLDAYQTNGGVTGTLPFWEATGGTPLAWYTTGGAAGTLHIAGQNGTSWETGIDFAAQNEADWEFRAGGNAGAHPGWFYLLRSDGVHPYNGNFIFAVDNTHADDLYLGGTSTTPGSDAAVDIMASENNHIYTHGSAPTISSCTGTDAVCTFGAIKARTTATITQAAQRCP